MDMKKVDKEAFFKDLYKLDEPDDVLTDIVSDPNIADVEDRFDRFRKVENFDFVKSSSCIDTYRNINLEQEVIPLDVSSRPTSADELRLDMAAKSRTASQCESGCRPASTSAGNVHREVSMPSRIGRRKKCQTKGSSPIYDPIFSGLTFCMALIVSAKEYVLKWFLRLHSKY